ncbi:hypothetical protein LSTR_LSTR005745 [Laodelphax striatellus]|uniref:PH domain-containing protein n=1 Tax=Laodelphax striatellus TaxID=195883 RepID=A0A482XI89_LAOST|nr:hypothetical protein LSTR_LSTR005745 [Laodelphax striatellus]
MVCRWKRLWFVLKGRLLHYYKSQMDYINLSPCHGSLNMGIAANVHPGKGLELQILTRSQTIILRAVNKQEHEQWLQALVDAMAHQDYIQTHSLKPVQHFRYSSNEVLYGEIKDNRMKTSIDKGSTSAKPVEKYKKRNEDEVDDENSSAMDDTSSLLSKSTVSNFGSCLLDHCPYRYKSVSKQGSTSRISDICTNTKQNFVNKRLEKLTLCRPNGVTSSDISIPTTLMKQQKILDQSTLLSMEDRCQSLKELRLSTNDDNLNSSEIGLKLLKDKDICFSAESKSCLLAESSKKLAPNKVSSNNLSKKLVTRSESLSSLKSKTPMDKKQLQEMKILIEGKTVYGSNDSIYRRTASEKSRLLKGDILYKRDVEKIIARRLGNGLYENTEIKSDTDLSMRNHTQSYSGSCGHLSTVAERVAVENFSVNSGNETTTTTRNAPDNKVDSETTSIQNEEPSSQTCNKLEGNFQRVSLKLSTPVSKLIKENGSSESSRERGLERKGTLKKRSLSFLKRMWKWKEEKMEGSKSEKEKIESSSEVEKSDNETSDENDSSNETSAVVIANESEAALFPEPPPDYDLHYVPDISMDDEAAPVLPPRSGSQRSISPWHDVPTNNQPVCSAHEHEDKPPPLPIKTRKSTTRSTSSTGSATENASLHSNSTTLSVNGGGTSKFHSQFDSLEGISDSVFVPEQENLKQDVVDENPVYDVPRLHGSLIARKESLQDSLVPTHFLNNSNLDLHKVPSNSFEEDSLDVNPALWRSNDLDHNFTPDSLECDNLWSESKAADAFQMTWSTNIEEGHLTKPFLSTREKSFEDLQIKGHDLSKQVELATN